jgi:type I restriction enzyme S subunit
MAEYPKDWNNLKLIEIGRIQDGNWILKEDYADHGVRLIQIGDVGIGKFLNKSNRYITIERAKELDCNFIDPEMDILISRMPDPIGRACLAPNLSTPYIVAVDIAIFKPNFSVNKDYLIQILNFYRTLAIVNILSSGGTRRRISRKNLENVSIPIPPLPEQRKIAAILFSVDNAIQETDAIIAQMERTKKGLMQELLTKGIGHTEFKNTSIGRIPKDWDVVYLCNKKYFNLKTGGTPSTKVAEYWNGDIPWLLSGEIHKRRIYNTLKTISKLGYENSNATLLPTRSVLIALAGQGKTRGTVAITEIELTTNQSIAAIISNEEYVSPYYIYYVLDTMYKELRAKSFGAGRAGLSLTILREIGIPFPSLFEQQKIAATLLSIDDKLYAETKQREHLDKLRKGLMQDLLTGKVRVKVGAHA